MPIDPDELILNFAEHVSSVRIKLELSQEQVAQRSELSLSTISRIESGALNPSLTSVFAIALALELTPAQLLKGLE